MHVVIDSDSKKKTYINNATFFDNQHFFFRHHFFQKQKFLQNWFQNEKFIVMVFVKCDFLN